VKLRSFAFVVDDSIRSEVFKSMLGENACYFRAVSFCGTDPLTDPLFPVSLLLDLVYFPVAEFDTYN
jgi:hypothetical protein